jgi:copper transporter 1
MTHNHADMSSMDMSTSSTSTTMTMSAVFINSHTTALYSNSWAPASTTSYAFTCIFLVILSVVLRGLLVVKSVAEARWKAQALQRPFVVTATSYRDEESKIGTSQDIRSVASGSSASDVQAPSPAKRSVGWNRPWRLSVDLPRAALVTVIAGVGYLLMLAVMSMNIGYFLSILAGAFVGELAVGRFAHVVERRKEF